MVTTVTATFDGQVLQPDWPLELEVNTRYLITVHKIPTKPENGTAWGILAEFTGTIEAPSDWSEEHDHYLYGVPKQHNHERKTSVP